VVWLLYISFDILIMTLHSNVAFIVRALLTTAADTSTFPPLSSIYLTKSNKWNNLSGARSFIVHTVRTDSEWIPFSHKNTLVLQTIHSLADLKLLPKYARLSPKWGLYISEPNSVKSILKLEIYFIRLHLHSKRLSS